MKRTSVPVNVKKSPKSSSMNVAKKDETVRAIALVVSDDIESGGQTFGKHNLKEVIAEGD